MPKQKTHKGSVKRIRQTGSGKLVHRSAGQSHFNSRDTGKNTKNKRRDSSLNKGDIKRARILINK